jgi:sulfite reductase (NADPH) hemoprotein beta-component
MGRTPVIGTVMRVPALEPDLNYIEAIVRVYNRYGRRDNKYKARIKILVKAEGQASSTRSRGIPPDRRAGRRPHTITQAEFDRVAATS